MTHSRQGGGERLRAVQRKNEMECITQTENSEETRRENQITKGQTCCSHTNPGSCCQEKRETGCLIFGDWYL